MDGQDSQDSTNQNTDIPQTNTELPEVNSSTMEVVDSVSQAPEPTQVLESTIAPETPLTPVSEETSPTPEIASAPAEPTAEIESIPAEPTPEIQAAVSDLANSESPALSSATITSNTKPAKKSKNRKAKASQADDQSELKSQPATNSGSTFSPATSQTMQTATKKKPRTGRIVAIIIALVVVFSLVGLALWYFLYYNNVDKIAFDAIHGALATENLALDGEVVMNADPNNKDSEVQRIAFDFNTASTRIPSQGKVKVAIDMRKDPDFDLEVEYMQKADGIFYLRMDGLMEIMDRAGLTKEQKDSLTTTFELIEDVDGEWWEVSIVDVLKALEVDRTTADFSDQLYTCATDLGSSEYGKELADLYLQDQYKFVDIQKVSQIDTDGHWFSYQAGFGESLYEVTLDKHKLADFINYLPETKVATTFVDCVNEAWRDYAKGMSSSYSSTKPADNLIDPDDIDEISAYDIKIPEEFKLYLQIADLSHRLEKVIATYYEKDIMNLSFNLNLDYRKALVNPPSDYQPLTDLIDDERLEEVSQEIWLSQAIDEDLSESLEPQIKGEQGQL